MDDDDILEAANDLLVAGVTPTPERLAARLNADVDSLNDRLAALEGQGKLLPISVWWADSPDDAHHSYWVQPGSLAETLTADRYETCEELLHRLASQKGYRVVSHGGDLPLAQRRYELAVTDADGGEQAGDGQQIEQVALTLRQMPDAPS